MGSLTGKYAVWMVGWLMTGAVMANDTTLLGAVKNGELDTVQQLIADGTDVNVSSLDGSSALLLATRANHIAIAQALIEAGANVNQKNLIRDSPYLLAGARGRNEILAFALAHGADLKSTKLCGAIDDSGRPGGCHRHHLFQRKSQIEEFAHDPGEVRHAARVG